MEQMGLNVNLLPTMMGKLRRDLTCALLCAATWITGCEGVVLDWGEEHFVTAYDAALIAVHDEAGAGDTLFVSAYPRFLNEVGVGAVQMGDFNRHGDPALMRAITTNPTLVFCVPDSGGGCDRMEHEGFAMVSEVLPVGRREALLLASFVDLRSGGVVTKDLFVHLRFRRHEWGVARVGEGDVVGVSEGVGR